MRTVTFSVDGMRCRRCVRRATALVRDVDGVHAVTAVAKSGLLTVHGTMTGIDIVRPPGNTTFAARLVDEDPKPDF
jgi:copper chaperone CopZ